MKYQIYKAGFLAGLWVLMGASHLFGFAFEVSDPTFIPETAKTTLTCIVRNSGSRVVAAEVSIKKRAQDLSGMDILTDDNETILVVPSQILVPPKDKQIVSLIWQGKGFPETEQSFRVICEELPIDLSESGTSEITGQVKIVRRYVSSIYVAPKDAEPDVVVVSAVPTQNAGQTDMAIILENQGSAHVILKQLSLRMWEEATPSAAVVISPQPMRGVFNLLAGSRRQFQFPWPKAIADRSAVKVELVTDVQTD